MKKLLKKISPRMALAICLALLMILSLALHTTGGQAKYRTQTVVSGKILYTQPTPQIEPGPADTTDPENTEPENTEPENTEPENTEPETTEPETGEETAQP